MKNHLFLIYGIINYVLFEDNSCIDIQIYDLVKAFDRLWLEDCMNDLFDSPPSEQQDDKLALVYQGNIDNEVAVNTSVGLTKRVNMVKITPLSTVDDVLAVAPCNQRSLALNTFINA